jgi:hypothetical protein
LFFFVHHNPPLAQKNRSQVGRDRYSFRSVSFGDSMPKTTHRGFRHWNPTAFSLAGESKFFNCKVNQLEMGKLTPQRRSLSQIVADK